MQHLSGESYHSPSEYRLNLKGFSLMIDGDYHPLACWWILRTLADDKKPRMDFKSYQPLSV